MRIDELAADLKALRRGLGVQEMAVPSVAGAAVRELCGVHAGDPAGTVRQKIIDRLRDLVDRLPASKQPLARAVFGLDNPDDAPYTTRLAQLGRVVERDTRTMQRYADAVIHRIAELACAVDEPAPLPGQFPWHTRELQVRVLLRGPQVEVFETRRVVSHQAELTEVEHAVSLAAPAPAGGPVDLSVLGIDEIAGGEVHAPRMVSAQRVAFTLRPPVPLAIGEEHAFFFRVRVPTMAPFYCCTPEFACERFTLTVNFPRDRVPSRIWRIDGELSMQAHDPTPTRETLHADNSGGVRAVFTDLHPARSYGIGWTPLD
ncbi:hypothetical protein [Actinokineospora sp. NBRC 105648]|uniref:hypothetical protein n=1 Tax=Actinokineospora sp. NBRC 105648 TaxID=3032206 RepID=UPI002555694F|nr:hypothetical protein [Actinokineospora sp. NBRC 105648]